MSGLNIIQKLHNKYSSMGYVEDFDEFIEEDLENEGIKVIDKKYKWDYYNDEAEYSIICSYKKKLYAFICSDYTYYNYSLVKKIQVVDYVKI